LVVAEHAAWRTSAPDKSYRKRIGKFINGRQPARMAAESRNGMLDVALASMQVMQGTISQLRLARPMS